MSYNPDIHHRRSVRLQGYDYRQEGAYFVTICTYQREYLFGDVVEGEKVLNQYGKIAESCWRDIPAHFPHAVIDAFVIMPNHMHGIVLIDDSVTRISNKNTDNPGNIVGTRPAVSLPPEKPYTPEKFSKPVAGSLSTIVRSYKSAVTRQTRQIQNSDDALIWQSRYHDVIIRNEKMLNTLREYIQTNPAQWTEDRFYSLE